MFGIFKRNREANKIRTQEGVKRSRDRWFGRVLDLLRSSRLDDSVWEELEEILISSDVGVETSLRVIEDLKERVRREALEDPDQVFEYLKDALAQDLEQDTPADVWLEAELPDTPFVILMVGVNGVGKTTSIAKLAHHFTQAGKKVVLGAADTFRAAAEEQLEVLGERVGVDVISHNSGADPGAVAYDSYEACRSRGADVLIVDTARTVAYQVQPDGGAAKGASGPEPPRPQRAASSPADHRCHDGAQRSGAGQGFQRLGGL